ncbi:Respiratory burst oxidase-like protein B [Hibiscus syriacus]|uniref:Respiratory burst oxidase-like protein B n=1 Tax=Hibiscus syriacus TaxID=106335 RepID=A0A6A2XH78_HIBSY|nr:Respiratory burst oxidase-like protein B [Hibiscus syriacus]
MGYCVTTAKGAAETTKFNMALILLPVCRNTITWLRSKTKLGVVVPFDDNINFHEVCGCFWDCYWSWLACGANLACDFPLLLHATDDGYEPMEQFLGEERPNYYWRFVKGTEGWTGVTTVVLMAIVYILAQPWFHRNQLNLPTPIKKLTGFSAFWHSHHLFISLCPLHCSWILSLPLQEMVAVYPVNVLSLQMTKPQGFKYTSGQYIFVNCADVCQPPSVDQSGDKEKEAVKNEDDGAESSENGGSSKVVAEVKQNATHDQAKEPKPGVKQNVTVAAGGESAGNDAEKSGNGSKKNKKKGQKANVNVDDRGDAVPATVGSHLKGHEPNGMVRMPSPTNHSRPRQHPMYTTYYHAPPVYLTSYNTAYPNTDAYSSYPSYSSPPSESYSSPPSESYSSPPSDSFEMFSDENPNASMCVDINVLKIGSDIEPVKELTGPDMPLVHGSTGRSNPVLITLVDIEGNLVAQVRSKQEAIKTLYFSLIDMCEAVAAMVIAVRMSNKGNNVWTQMTCHKAKMLLRHCFYKQAAEKHQIPSASRGFGYEVGEEDEERRNEQELGIEKGGLGILEDEGLGICERRLGIEIRKEIKARREFDLPDDVEAGQGGLGRDGVAQLSGPVPEIQKKKESVC